MLVDAPSTVTPVAATRAVRVAVLGAGYVGLVSGACLAALGHDVTIVEIDPRRLGALRGGRLPVREAGLDELVAGVVRDGRLRFAGDHGAAAWDRELVMLAVGTPSGADGRIDLSAIEAAVRTTAAVAPGVPIVIKSTVPPGTAARMERLARDLGAVDTRVISNPEFLREGNAVRDFMVPDRIVIGARDGRDRALLERLYEPLDAPVHCCLPEDAELTKYASNALLAARISFINEVSGIADAVGADIARVSDLVGRDPRIGPSFLAAGLGWGGSCFPKDVRGLASVAEDLGLGAPLLRAVIEANERQRHRALTDLLALLAGRTDPRVALLGLAFKPLTDDVRESSALWLAGALAHHGVLVRATDPWAIENAEQVEPRIAYTPEPLDAVEGADVAVLATEWPAFLALSWRDVAARMRGTAVFDARNALDAGAVRSAGLTYRSLGRNVLGTSVETLCVS